MRAVAVIAVAVIIVCGAAGPPVATPADAQRANVPIGELEEGRKIAVTKCAACHVAPLPSEDWDAKLDEMVEKAKLDSNQRRLLVQYMTVMAPGPR